MTNVSFTEFYSAVRSFDHNVVSKAVAQTITMYINTDPELSSLEEDYDRYRDFFKRAEEKTEYKWRHKGQYKVSEPPATYYKTRHTEISGGRARPEYVISIWYFFHLVRSPLADDLDTVIIGEKFSQFWAKRKTRTKTESASTDNRLSGDTEWQTLNGPEESVLRIVPSYYAKKADHSDRRSHLLVGYEPHDIEERVKRFLTKSKKGYLLLSAGPGMGKSSIMAHLAGTIADQVVYYAFVVTYGAQETNRSNYLQDFLLASIIDIFRPSFDFQDNGDTKTKRISAYLHRLAKAKEISQDRPFVILIDGVDEMGDFAPTERDLTNLLHLPDVLPEGVFVIVSFRQVTVNVDRPRSFRLPSPSAHIDLMDELHADQHIETARRFVTRTCESNPEMLAFHGTPKNPSSKHAKSQFVQSVLDGTDCNFMLMKCLLLEKSNWRSPDFTSCLTRDLEDYYQQHFERMTQNDAYGVEMYATYCFAIRHEISQNMLLTLLQGTNAHFDPQQGMRAIDEWNNQGLLLARQDASTTWYTPYHETYFNYLKRRFESENQKLFADRFLNLLTHDGDLVAMVSVLDELAEDKATERNEWLKVTLTLIVNSGQHGLLIQLLNQEQFWTTSSRWPGALNDVFETINILDVREDCYQSISAHYAALVDRLLRLSRSGELRDANNTAVTETDLFKLVDSYRSSRHTKTSGPHRTVNLPAILSDKLIGEAL